MVLARVVCQEAQITQTEAVKYLRADAVIALVGRETQVFIGLDGVSACVLQGIGVKFVFESDAASFLAHVEKYARAGFSDHLEGLVELLAAVATERTKDVTSEAFGMYAYEDRFVVNLAAVAFGFDLTFAERQVEVSINAGNIGKAVEVAPLGWQACGNAMLDDAFGIGAVADNVFH